MVGLERSILPELAEKEFHLIAKTAILSFILVFGLSKAITNYIAGILSDRYSRKAILVFGWVIAAPVPYLLIHAPSWNWVLAANMLLGISQGLTWSTTVIMKIDLVGPHRRGIAMGLNEFAGYFSVALSALLTGFIAAHWGLRPEPFYLGYAYVGLGLMLSVLLIRDTRGHVEREVSIHGYAAISVSQKEVFLQTSFSNRNLSSIVQAGFVNNLNDGMAWGLFPILFAMSGLEISKIGWLAAIYPATWGILQIWTGHLSDSRGRKGLITWGMWVQAAGIFLTASSEGFSGFAGGAVLLGVGTAMVYPTLLAAIGDVAHPSWRASAVGVYRFWRDSGYAVGALISGIVSDFFGVEAAIALVGVVTFGSGVVVMFRMSEASKTDHSLFSGR